MRVNIDDVNTSTKKVDNVDNLELLAELVPAPADPADSLQEHHCFVHSYRYVLV